MAAYAITTSNAKFNFDSTNSYNACYKIDANHFINFWAGSGDDGFVQTFVVNTTTWAITTSSATLEYDTTTGLSRSNVLSVDVNHFSNIWRDSSGDGRIQIFAVNTSTWAVTTAGAILEFDTQNMEYGNCYMIDSTHILNYWAGGNTPSGYAQVFTVNTTTWAVTTAASALNFHTRTVNFATCQKIDANHFIGIYHGLIDSGASYDGWVQTYAINTTTWAVTTTSNRLSFDSTDANYVSSLTLDANHFVAFYSGSSADGYAQVFAVNTSTYAVSTASAGFTFTAGNDISSRPSAYLIDSTHFVLFYDDSTTTDGVAQVFTFSTSTWAISTSSTSLTFETTSGRYNSCYQVDTTHFINFWNGTSGGNAEIFYVEPPASGPANLKTYNTNIKANIKTINTNPIANVKSLNTNT